MHIVVVTHYFSTHLGGVESVAGRLADALARSRGVSIHWLASACNPAPSDLHAGVIPVAVPCSNAIERLFGLPYPIWSPLACRRIVAAVRMADCIHLHDSMYLGNVLVFLIARAVGKPVLITQHTGMTRYPLLWQRAAYAALDLLFARRLLSRANKVVFVSPASREQFAARCRFRSTPVRIANGVNTDLYAFADVEQQRRLRQRLGRNTDRPVCLFVGRFVRMKGLPLLLEIVRRTPHVDWIIAGDGPLSPESACLPNVTVVRGKTGRDIAELYAVADLLVHPSEAEGFPLVVQEAMACGTPALVSPPTRAGSPEASSLLFVEQTAVIGAADRWSERIQALIAELRQQPEMRLRVSQLACRLWSWETTADSYYDVLLRCSRKTRLP